MARLTPYEALPFRRQFVNAWANWSARGGWFKSHGLVDFLAPHECARRANIYWVHPDMTQLAAAAAKDLPSFELRSEDIPCKRGLIVFGGDGVEFLDAGKTVSADGELLDGSPQKNWLRGAMWQVVFDSDDNVRRFIAYFCVDHIPGKYPEGYGWRPGQIDYIHSFSQIPIDAGPRTWDSGDCIDQLTSILLSSIVLMQQPGVGDSHEALPTVQDRSLLKKRRVDLDAVRVITLRRPAKENSRVGGGREYHHRWMVRGHWRNQWYPSRDGHKPIWISPHIKGPEDAPLLTGEKVYAWVR